MMPAPPNEELFKTLSLYPKDTFYLNTKLHKSSLDLNTAAYQTAELIRKLGLLEAPVKIQKILDVMTMAECHTMIEILEGKRYPRVRKEKAEVLEVTTRPIAQQDLPALCLAKPKHEGLPVIFSDVGTHIEVRSLYGDVLIMPTVSQELSLIAKKTKGFGYLKVADPYNFLKKKLENQQLGLYEHLVVSYIFMGTDEPLKDSLITETLLTDYDKTFTSVSLGKSYAIESYEQLEKVYKDFDDYSLLLIPNSTKIASDRPIPVLKTKHRFASIFQVADGMLHYRGFNTSTQVATLSSLKEKPDNISDMFLVEVAYTGITFHGKGMVTINDPVFIREYPGERPAITYEQLLNNS
jgi:hypothetical protein